MKIVHLVADPDSAVSAGNTVRPLFHHLLQEMDQVMRQEIEYPSAWHQWTIQLDELAARRLSHSREIRDYLLHAPCWPFPVESKPAAYGLPDRLYGLPLEVVPGAAGRIEMRGLDNVIVVSEIT